MKKKSKSLSLDIWIHNFNRHTYWTMTKTHQNSPSIQKYCSIDAWLDETTIKDFKIKWHNFNHSFIWRKKRISLCIIIIIVVVILCEQWKRMNDESLLFHGGLFFIPCVSYFACDMCTSWHDENMYKIETIIFCFSVT